MKIVKSLEVKQLKMRQKKRKGGFLKILSGTLVGSLLESALAVNGVIKADQDF